MIRQQNSGVDGEGLLLSNLFDDLTQRQADNAVTQEALSAIGEECEKIGSTQRVSTAVIGHSWSVDQARVGNRGATPLPGLAEQFCEWPDTRYYDHLFVLLILI
ncbi:MAG: hypothetical protein R3F53_18855 [Gammaproteobacteria bacterium]